MKVVSIGGGAMGGLFAARLSMAGVDVTVVDTSPEVVEIVNARGIVLVEQGERTSVRVAATTSIPASGTDVAVVFVKAQHTKAVADALVGRLGENTTVASLQNGWGNADVLARVVPAEQLVVGVTYHSCTLESPGTVVHGGTGPTFVGPFLAAGETKRAERLAELFDSAGIKTTPTAEILPEIWKKLVLNAATLPVAAVTGLRAGEIRDDAEVLAVVDALAAEAVAVARAQGYDLSLPERLDRIHAVLQGAATAKPSMLQDVELKRGTEIDVICGAIVRASVDVGLPVPLNRAVVALIHGIERSWER